MPEQDNRLLLREKDYELRAARAEKQFKVCFRDPLINLPRPKKQIGSTGLLVDPRAASKNPLANQSRPSSKTEYHSKKQAANKSIAVAQGEESTSREIPWQKTLQHFVKVYDYRQEQHQPMLVNVFGSQGKKKEETLRAKLGGPQETAKQGSVSTRKNASAAQVQETKQTIKLCIGTYLSIVSDMKSELRTNWAKQDKVASLQITIQSCKLLHDSTHAKFHAVKFAHVMQIVEQFGVSVFERIKKLSFPKLTDQQAHDLSIKDLEDTNIPETAQEICRNWINKISSIRELLPRAFIETTLLRLYCFIDNGANLKKVLKRLVKSNRCFGDYINCVFFCTFLIRVGRQVLPQEKDYILDILDEIFFYVKQGRTKFCRDDLSYDQFFGILEPFFISSFESLSENLDQDKFRTFCRMFPQNPHPVILKSFILSFSLSLLVRYSVDIVRMLQKVHRDDKFQIYRLLLNRLSEEVFAESGQFIVLVWTDLSEVGDLETLLELLGPFSQIIFRNLGRLQKNQFYSLILEVFNDRFYNFRAAKKSIFNSFQFFLTGILHKTEDIRDILTLEPFLQIICYFPTANKRSISQKICQTLLSRKQDIRDPLVIHIMMDIMRNMQGMQGTQIKQVTLQFLSRVDFGTDFQQHLKFLGEMRATFSYMQEVIIALIYKAVSLTFAARKHAKGKITRKLISFLQATIAYCYITLPVLEDMNAKLNLYIYLSEIALANNLISQATALIKTCIKQLAEVDSESDQEIYEIYRKIIAFLIVMPDDPESPFLFLFNGTFQAFAVTKFKSDLDHIIRFQFYTLCTVYLSCQAQERLPFHFSGVVSNDGLFKSQEFRSALIDRIHSIFQELEKSIKLIEIILKNVKINSYVLVHLIECVMTLITVFDVTPRLTSLIIQVLKIIEKAERRAIKFKMRENPVQSLAALKRRLQQIDPQILEKCGWKSIDFLNSKECCIF